MRKSMPVYLFAIIAAVFAMTACAGPQVGGVSANKGLPELDEEESDAFCEHMTNQFESYWEDDSMIYASCAFAGVMSALFVSDDHGERVMVCEEAMDECRAEFAAGGLEIGEEEVCFSDAERNQCDVTVAEFDACYSAAMDWGFEPILELAQYTCEDFVSDEGIHMIERAARNIETMENDFPDVEECRVIRDRCPGL